MSKSDASGQGLGGALTVTYRDEFTKEARTIALYRDRYLHNGAFALAAIDLEDVEENYLGTWGTISVNLPEDPQAAAWCSVEGRFVLDENNMPQGLIHALVDDGIIELSEERVRSGFCTYPLARVRPEALGRLRSYDETLLMVKESLEVAEHEKNDDILPERPETFCTIRWMRDDVLEAVNRACGTSLERGGEEVESIIDSVIEAVGKGLDEMSIARGWEIIDTLMPEEALEAAASVSQNPPLERPYVSPFDRREPDSAEEPELG